MALADELLDSISEEQFAEYMLVEENPHIVIDEDRNIILPERYKIIAAQGDHDMTTYTFDCPRFSDGRDMSKMVVYINYIRSDGETGSYPADNVSIDAQDNDLMHFEWTPLLPATLEHGAFAFLVCVCRAEPDGSIKNHWSTRLCKDATISEGMDCHKDTIINMYPDVITRILERLNVLEDGGTTSVQYTVQDLEEEQKVQARKNIEAADAKEVSKLSEDIATKASAIKETASGELIIVNDSAEAKVSGLAIDGKSEQNQYSGKNLLPNKGTTQTIDNVSFTVSEDGRITVNGTPSDDVMFYVATKTTVGGMLVEPGSYILSGCPSGGSDSAYRLQMWGTKESGGFVYDYGSGASAEITNTDGNYNIVIFIKGGYTAQNLVFKPMLRLATVTDGTYEPYCGGIPSPNPSYPQEIRNIGVYDEASGKYAVGVEFAGKNKLDVSKLTVSNNPTNTGLEVSLVDDVFRLTATSVKFGGLGITNSVTLSKGKYIMSVDKPLPFHLRLDSAFVLPKNEASIVFELMEERTFNNIAITTNVGDSFDVEFRLMIRLAEITDDTYEPYKETTATVLLDEPLRKGDKVYWNGGSKLRIDRYRAVEVFDGSEDEGWTESANSEKTIYRCRSNKLASLIEKQVNPANISDLLCDSLIASSPNLTYLGNSGIAVDSGGTLCVFEPNYNTSDISLWKAHLVENPITVEYKLATPITEEIDLSLDGLSMFYPTTVISNDCNANMEVEYIADTKAYIDKKFAELATAMV